MDKKNTMLLSVIAVATLLVAVVGATFAYFTATSNTNGTTAGVTATTGTLSTVNLNGSAKTLKIDTVVGDFAYTDTDREPYYATTTTGYASEAQNHVLGQVSVAGDGKFNCTYSIKVTGTNVPADMIAADGKVVVTGSGITGGTLNIADLTTTGTTINGSFTGLTKASSDTITVDAYLVNTSQPQNYLQGLTGDSALKIDVAVSAFSCTNVA